MPVEPRFHSCSCCIGKGRYVLLLKNAADQPQNKKLGKHRSSKKLSCQTYDTRDSQLLEEGVAMFGGSVNRVKDLKRVGDLTSFTWQVGKFRSLSFGDDVRMVPPVRCGLDEWQLVSFAPDYGDRKRKATKGKARSSSRSETASSQGTHSSRPSSAKSSSASSRSKGNASLLKLRAEGHQTASDVSSQASMSKSQSSSQLGRDTAAQGHRSGSFCSTPLNAQTDETTVKSLTQTFTTEESSWGWEGFIELDKLFNPRCCFLTGYETDIQDGIFSMNVEIFAITGVEFEPPETDYEITLQGRQRTRWMIKDLEGIHSKVSPDLPIL
eukprot:768429-Hanusia_phi.AAC.17